MTPELDFPAALPCFLREGYSLNHTQPFARTEMATGRARQRRTFQSVPSEITASLLLTDGEAQLFEAWFAYDADDGAKWFNARVKTPQGLKPYACRFIEMYRGPQLTGNNQWRVECRLEIFERPLTPPEWYRYGQEFILGSSIIDIAINDKWPAFTFDHTTYAAAFADIGNIEGGSIIYIESDETQGGQHARYSVYRAPEGATLILDFANQGYYVYDKDDALILEETWPQ